MTKERLTRTDILRSLIAIEGYLQKQKVVEGMTIVKQLQRQV